MKAPKVTILSEEQIDKICRIFVDEKDGPGTISIKMRARHFVNIPYSTISKYLKTRGLYRTMEEARAAKLKSKPTGVKHNS